MTRDAAVAEIRKNLGRRPSAADIDTLCVEALQKAQRDMEQGKTLPWFLLEEDTTLTLVAGTNSIALPAGFLREEETEPVRYTPTSSTIASRLLRRVYWDALDAYGSSEASGPQVYVIRKTTIHVRPTADVNYTLTWSYYKADVVLTTNVENKWLQYAPDLMIGEAGFWLAGTLRDTEGGAVFDSMRKAGRAALFAEILAREESGGPISLGSAL